MEKISPRRIFVTGGTGYLGGALLPQLLARGHHVTALVRPGSEKRLPSGCRVVVGDALNAQTFQDQVLGYDTFVQLVGVQHPAAWKAKEFKKIDLTSIQAAVQAATTGKVAHFVYVSVADRAPTMKAYAAVRRQGERLLVASGMATTILRPWYILGPGHWWPLFLIPLYRLLEHLPSTRESAVRLGLVRLPQMIVALVQAIEHPVAGHRFMDVSQIRKA